MNLQELIELAGERDLAKSYPKADGVYVWDYKVLPNKATNVTELHLIPSDSGKAGFKDKVSVQELVEYVTSENVHLTVPIVGVEGITIARI